MGFRPSTDLVRAVLMEATAFDWSWQGLGMFRLMLSREVRLHVWIPESAVPNVTTIHSHPWNFESKIICGKMINRCYREASRDDIGRLGFQSVQWMRKQEIVCGPSGGMKGEPRQVALYCTGDLVLDSGSSYSMRHDEIHESIPEVGTISIIKREFRDNTEDAFVYHPANVEWVSALPRPASKEEVIAMAHTALARLVLEARR